MCLDIRHGACGKHSAKPPRDPGRSFVIFVDPLRSFAILCDPWRSFPLDSMDSSWAVPTSLRRFAHAYLPIAHTYAPFNTHFVHLAQPRVGRSDRQRSPRIAKDRKGSQRIACVEKIAKDRKGSQRIAVLGIDYPAGPRPVGPRPARPVGPRPVRGRPVPCWAGH
jgi:hypothetical protein